MRTPTSVNQYVVNQHHLHPGIAGGMPGSPDSCVIAEGTDHEVRVNPTVAGGGHGDGRPAPGTPASVVAAGGATRSAGDPEAVLDDGVWDEYECRSTPRHNEYGVVITGSLDDMTLALDRDATERLRADLRAAR